MLYVHALIVVVFFSNLCHLFCIPGRGSASLVGRENKRTKGDFVWLIEKFISSRKIFIIVIALFLRPYRALEVRSYLPNLNDKFLKIFYLHWDCLGFLSPFL